MKKLRLMNLEKIIEPILRKEELARCDDCYLILQVVRKLYPYESGRTFANVMMGAKQKGISFESITRCRRRLQKKYPELKDEYVAQKRDEEQQEYIDYSREE